MAEYIEREAAETVIKFVAKQKNPIIRLALSEAKEAIHFLVAADVEPIRHGRWSVSPTSIRSVKKTNIPEAVCSFCGERFCDITKSVTLYRFCPNCGAKMDLEAENG